MLLLKEVCQRYLHHTEHYVPPFIVDLPSLIFKRSIIATRAPVAPYPYDAREMAAGTHQRVHMVPATVNNVPGSLRRSAHRKSNVRAQSAQTFEHESSKRMGAL